MVILKILRRRLRSKPIHSIQVSTKKNVPVSTSSRQSHPIIHSNPTTQTAMQQIGFLEYERNTKFYKHHYRVCPLQSNRNLITDGILVRTYESRLDLMRVLILGPKNTPYENAPFLFDF